MTSFTTESIEKFTAMVKRSVIARATSVRLDMNDATSLTAEIANVMARLALLENKTVQRHESTTAQMDGGSFER
jgi:hypothetical protein